MLTLRADADVDRALDYLVSQAGGTRSQVVRSAVLQAEREARHEAMRQEALRLRSDEADVAEAKNVNTFMGGSDAW